MLQDQAKRWLAEEAFKYDLVTSQFVVNEVSRGDPDAANERLKLLLDVRVLIPDAEVEQVADEIGSIVAEELTNNDGRVSNPYKGFEGGYAA